MRLLEIIPTEESDKSAIEKIAQFCDIHLGKGIVRAKDTPNFIGNRIGHLLHAQRHAPDAGYGFHH